MTLLCSSLKTFAHLKERQIMIGHEIHKTTINKASLHHRANIKQYLTLNR